MKLRFLTAFLLLAIFSACTGKEPETFIPKAILGDERTTDPPQEQTYGWFLTRNDITNAYLQIVNWSFYTA